MTAPVSSTPGASSPTDVLPVTNAAGGTLNKDDFMKLLVAQMTHQDPLNPQDGAAMASQLAQFSSVEQLMNINTELATQGTNNAGLIGAVNNSATIGLLGKDVTVQSSQIAVGTKGTQNVSADIPAAGGHLSMRITDASGNTVKTIDLGTVTGGHQTYPLADATSGLPVGTYGVALDLGAAGAAASAVTHPPTYIDLHVDGVKFGAQGAQITSGTLTFPISVITSVTAASSASSTTN